MRQLVTTAAILCALIGAGGVLASAAQGASTSASSSGRYAKAVAPRGAFAPNQAGVQLLQDYGSFALYKVDAGAVADAPPEVRIDSEADVLQFTAHRFDTQRDRLTAPAAFSMQPGSNPGLQVVQFIGPIKQEWLDALSARGIKPVQYVASNGYIVWTEADAQAQLVEMSGHSSWLQFSAPLHGFLKVDPRLGARVANARANDEVDVVVQVYRHDTGAETRAFIESRSVISPSQLGPLGPGKSSHAWTPVLVFENVQLRVRVSDIPAIADRPDVTSVGEYVLPEMLDEKQGIILTGNFAPGPASPSYLQFLIDHGFSQVAGDYPIVDVTDSTIDEGGTGATVVNTADNMLHVQGSLTKPSRVAYFKNCSALANSITGATDGHGSLNGGIIADYDERTGYPFQDSDGQRLGLGINPFGRIGSTAIFVPAFNIDNCGGTFQGVIQANARTGAKISSNSWGAAVNGVYDASAQAYDAGVRDADPGAAGNQEMIYVFAAGNSGPGAGTIGSPGTAKNVITVGASENLRPFATPRDNRCGPDPANDPRNVAAFSSRGPVQGERTKPEILAPGTRIQAGASNFAGYDGSGVCVKYFPETPAQQVFTYSSGTSHSTPAVAGVASLAYWWIQHGGAGAAAGKVTEIGGNRAPSPAMMKAWMIAHPSYLTGAGANDDLPSDAQGYGMPNMSDMFSATPKVLVDQSERFDNTGETRTHTLGVADAAKPVRIALAYTDAPGALAAGSLVNDLDLTVEANGQTYRGNSFDHQGSIPGGAADNRNNYEAVFLPAGTTGDVTITVTAANIAGDGVPNTGDATDQDFALVCSNCVLAPTFTLSTAQRAPSVCVGANYSANVAVGTVDNFAAPVNLSLSGNPAGTSASVTPVSTTPPASASVSITGSGGVAAGHYPLVLTGASGSITKTLQIDLSYASSAPPAPALAAPGDGARNVELHPTLSWQPASQASSYLVEVASDAGFAHIVASGDVTDTTYTVTPDLDSNTQYFWRVTAKNGCGQSGDQALADRLFGDGFDGAVPPTAAFTFSTVALLGDCEIGTTRQVLFSDDMESGAPGWLLGGDVNGSRWKLGGFAHSGTHALVANHDPFLAFEQDLTSPNIVLPGTLSKITLSFQNQQSLSGVPGGSCIQAALLEISTDNGATQTQVVDGLLTDPYDGIISASGSNPLHGMPGWCGNPQAYLNSVVDLTPYAGHTVSLTFSMADDTFEDGVGRPPDPAWAIDDVKVTGCAAN